MEATTYQPASTPISTREDISIWWNPRYRVYDITVRELTWDQDRGVGPEVAEVVYGQTHTYREARVQRRALIDRREQTSRTRTMEETEPVGIRLEGYRLGAPSYFCPECWDDRPEDFADAPGEALTREEAQGHRCATSANGRW